MLGSLWYMLFPIFPGNPLVQYTGDKGEASVSCPLVFHSPFFLWPLDPFGPLKRRYPILGFSAENSPVGRPWWFPGWALGLGPYL